MLKNQSLKVRFLVAPLIGVVLTLILYLASSGMLEKQTALFEDIHNSNLSQITEVSHTSVLLSNNFAKLAGLLLSPRRATEEEAVYIEGRLILDDLHILEHKLASALAANHLNSDQKSLYSQITHSLEQYRTAVIDAIELTTVNHERALYELQRASAAQETLSDLLRKLSLAYELSLHRQTHEINQIVQQSGKLTPLAMVLLVLMLASALYFSSRLAFGLDKITQALSSMAKGSSDIELPDNLDIDLKPHMEALRLFKCTLEENQQQRDKLTQQLQEIKESRERYSSVLKLSPTAIITINQQREIVQLNQAAEKMFGYQAEEALGKHIDILLTDDNREDYLQELSLFEDSDEQTRIQVGTDNQVLSGRHKRGEPLLIEANVSKVEFGKERFILVAVTDVTSQKKLEEELAEYRVHLEKMVVERTDALQQTIYRLTETQSQLIRAEKEAKQASMAKSDFLAHMSHEIRTPMNGIIAMAEMLEEMEFSSRQREYVNTIRLSASNLLTILSDILDLSKVEAGKIKIESHSFNLEAVLDEVVAVHAPEIAVKELAFAVSISEDVGEQVYSDSSRLRQILHNLLSNAVKFTPAQGTVSLDVFRPDSIGGQLGFKITDSGIGIPKSLQGKIFEPFVQADSSITRHYGGTGLGLQISKQLCELLGGGIHLESSEGQGTCITFSVRAPQAQSGERSQGTSESAASRAATDVRLLLVEDNPVNQKVAGAVLESLGYSVTVAANGQAALDALNHSPFDIVLMDCQMPVMDGYECTREIRQHADFSDVPIIAMTASATTKERQLCEKVGMSDFIAKPISKNLVKAVLNKWH